MSKVRVNQLLPLPIGGFSGYCRSKDHVGPVEVWVDSQDEWEDHMDSEHGGALPKSHIPAERRSLGHDRARGWAPREIPPKVRLTATEKEWIGQWVLTGGRIGQVWSLAPGPRMLHVLFAEQDGPNKFGTRRMDECEKLGRER